MSKSILQSASNTNVPIYGTVPWAAPEYLNARRIKERNEKGDLYSFGIIAWELLTGTKPWATEAYTPQDIVQLVCEGERLEIPSRCPVELAEILQECWSDGTRYSNVSNVIDPQKRPEFSALIDRIDVLL